MELSEEQIDDILVITLKAEILDASNSKKFRKQISPILEKSHKVVLAMDQVKFLDASGTGSLLSCLRQLNGYGGDLKLSGVQEAVLVLFNLVRMHRIIEIYDQSDGAVCSFQEDQPPLWLNAENT